MGSVDAPRRGLGRKSHYTNADVQAVWERIPDMFTEEQVNRWIADAAGEIIRRCREEDIPLPTIAYGFSGGKDSLALATIMRAVRDRPAFGVCGIVGPLEFRGHLRWLSEHIPDGVVIVDRKDLTPRWLADHTERLFPTGGRDGYWWTKAGTRWAQTRFIKAHAPRLMVYGRRLLDNNICGDERGLAMGEGGVLTHSPIRHWSHEQVLAVCYWHWVARGIPMPPIYAAPDGWTSGNGPWPGRHYPSHAEGWAGTYAIEPDAVIRAEAAGVPGAGAYLREVLG